MAYEAFLTVAGRGCGRLWVGSDVFFPQLLDVRNDARFLVEVELGMPFMVKDDDVVIGMHQGYQFWYMSTLDDDPPVSMFSEADRRPVPLADSFTQLVLDAL